MGSKWGQIYFSLLAMLCSWSAVMITETCLSSIGLGFGQVSVSPLGFVCRLCLIRKVNGVRFIFFRLAF